MHYHAKLFGIRSRFRMANGVSETPPKATVGTDISSQGTYGLDLSCYSSQNLACRPTASGDRQNSQREYRKLFFECNLHLVLQQQLRHNTRSCTRTISQLSGGAPSESQGKTKEEPTDAEVARLLRQHLNILAASQGATDAEVVEAAKVLERQYRPLVAGAAHERKFDDKDQATELSAESGTGSHTLVPLGRCDLKDALRGSSEIAARCCLEGFTLDASQAPDGFASDGGRGHSAVFPEHPAAGPEPFVTGLMLSQSQEAQMDGRP